MVSRFPRRVPRSRAVPSEVDRLGRGHQPQPYGQPQRFMANPIAISESISLSGNVNARQRLTMSEYHWLTASDRL